MAVSLEKKVNFQLWDAHDYNHRLHPEKLLHIIELSEKILHIEDEEIEIEYQGTTIEKYGVDFDGTNFMLISQQTNCLAKDKCAAPPVKQKISLKELKNTSSCTPGSGCC